MIDISTVVSAMVINILAAGGIVHSVNSFLPQVAAGQYSAFASYILNAVTATLISPFVFFNLLVGGLIGAIVAAVVGVASLSPALGFIGIIVTIILFLAIGLAYIKLIFKLFTAFFSIIISLIFSPIILLGNVMPGSTSISTWLLSLVGNLAVFPVASFFLVLSYALMCQPILSIIAPIGEITSKIKDLPGDGIEGLLGVNNLSGTGNIWTPPMTLIGDGTTAMGSLMLAAIGFGLLMMASKYCEMVEKALKTPPFPYGAAIGEGLKSGIGVQDLWAQSGYKLPFAGQTGGISSRLRGTRGAEVKPLTDAVTKMT
jgi:hypothetical protein